MPRLFSILLAALLLAAPVHASETPATAEAADPSEAAMTFVGGFSDTHLSGMLQRIGAREPRLIAASTLNAELLVAVFEAEIAQAVKVYGPEWQRNLALSWTPLLSDEEMTSLTTAGAQSPYADKYLELRGEAGQTMQGLSQDLFRQILTEVVNKTLAQLADDSTTPPAE